jgi:hypothetical protein
MRIDDLSNPQLVTIAVALLGGETGYVDREDIADKVNNIAPGRFNWRKYPERIDMVTVVVGLRDAKKPRNGGLLVGSNREGWMLSPAGLKWLRTLDLSTVQSVQSVKHRKDSIAAAQEAERARLHITRAYELFSKGRPEEITPQDFYEFARVNQYFQTKARQRRYTIIENATIDDGTLFELWDYLKERFPEEMT